MSWVLDFLGGVQKRSAEYDEQEIENIKKLKEGTGDETLKSTFKEELERANKEKTILESVRSAPNSEQSQILLGGYANQAEYRKALIADPELYHPMRETPTMPVYTSTKYGMSSGTTAGRIFESAFGMRDVEERPRQGAVKGSVTPFRRGVSKPQTDEGKARMESWRGNIKEDTKLTLQDTYNDEGLKVRIAYTGKTSDVWEGKKGWVQIGGPEPTKELTVAEKKWAPIQLIVDAIEEGRTVTQSQLDAAQFVINHTKEAFPLKYADALQSWESNTLIVRDLSFLSLVVDGKVVPATTDNIRAGAKEYGKTFQEYKKELYNTIKDK
jgi:hypothetical protein